MIEINGQQKNIFEQDWDIFIILDACRYDAFKSVYKDILNKEGVLKRSKTFCSGTFDWIRNNIVSEDCSDIIYLNPIILFEKRVPNNTFYEVKNVWKDNWDNYYGTIPPQKMTECAIKQINKHSTKRIIIHYHQPHPPFLNPEFRKHRKIVLTPKLVFDRDCGKAKHPYRNISSFLKGQIVRTFGPERAWKLMSSVGIEPNGMGQVYKHFSMEQVKEAYKENIRIALKSINKILDITDQKIIISSDHSYSYYGLKRGLKEEYVPWMEIK